MTGLFVLRAVYTLKVGYNVCETLDAKYFVHTRWEISILNLALIFGQFFKKEALQFGEIKTHKNVFPFKVVF